jgi:Fic family protein
MARPITFTLIHLLQAMASSTEWLGAQTLESIAGVARPTIIRRLNDAIDAGYVEAQGGGPLRQYRITEQGRLFLAPPGLATVEMPALKIGPHWRNQSTALLTYVRGPRSSRIPITYQESLIADYRPNQTFWLPDNLRSKLTGLGRITGERPAGTYARDILGQLLIDLSWESSRLEGNRYSRLETKALIEAGHEADGKTRQEAVMILNHKKAIEFLVDIAPYNDRWDIAIANIHSLLMDGLLRNEDGLGAIRNRLVTIEGSVYTPWQAPHELTRMYETLCRTGEAIEDPIEASFFLFTQIPYLQPFEDGNKRTSRVSCNLPLTKANLAPLAFMDVDDEDYFGALLGLYEKTDLNAAVDLFEWAYERSVQSYSAVRESMREPDPFRMRMREQLTEAVRSVVKGGLSISMAVDALDIKDEDTAPFKTMLHNELSRLTAYNCARFGLQHSDVLTWQKRNSQNVP